MIPVIAAVCGLVGVAVGALLNARRERKHWLRDEKLKAGTEFVTASRYLINQYRRVGEQGMDQVERLALRGRMQTARSALVLLGDNNMTAMTKRISDCLYATHPGESTEAANATESAFQDLIERLRADLSGKGLRRP